MLAEYLASMAINYIYIFRLIKPRWNAFSLWSFRTVSAWGSIETTTIRKTRTTLALEMLARILSLNVELKDRNRKRFCLELIHSLSFDRIQSEPSDMKVKMIDANSS